jgi:uncharacterized phiE125 gp8 family phage protein
MAPSSGATGEAGASHSCRHDGTVSEFVVVSGPGLEPLTLADAKNHLRVDVTTDDALIESMIRACRFHLERQYNIALITQTLQLNLDFFPYWWLWRGGSSNYYGWWLDQTYYTQILLRPPVQSIVSVTYTDPSGNPQTLASSNYVLDANNRPARLVPALNKQWPATAIGTINVAAVQFVAGYGAAPTNVPDDIQAAMKLMLGSLYANRESLVVDNRLVAVQLPLGGAKDIVDALMRPYEGSGMGSMVA